MNTFFSLNICHFKMSKYDIETNNLNTFTVKYYDVERITMVTVYTTELFTVQLLYNFQILSKVGRKVCTVNSTSLTLWIDS